MTRGWEFWLGSAFVLAAICLIGPAFYFDQWRVVVASIGSATAAFAVVGAALIAYDGALAKTRFDLRLELERKNAERVRRFLKTHMAAAQLYEEAGAVSRNLAELLPRGRRERVILSDFRIDEPGGLIEAWDHLDTIPSTCIAPLRGIRLRLGRIDRLIARYDAISIVDHFQAATVLETMWGEFTHIVDETKVIVDALQPTVLEYAPAPGPKT